MWKYKKCTWLNHYLIFFFDGSSSVLTLIKEKFDIVQISKFIFLFFKKNFLFFCMDDEILQVFYVFNTYRRFMVCYRVGCMCFSRAKRVYFLFEVWKIVSFCFFFIFFLDDKNSNFIKIQNPIFFGIFYFFLDFLCMIKIYLWLLPRI